MNNFRFGSGQILELSDQLINQIPYLLGLTSFGQYSKTVFDQDGNFKLDPNINFNHFLIIIDILPIQSASQILIRLPEHSDSLEIMLLIDYLGLLPSPHPTLAEIDSIFLFSFYNYNVRGRFGERTPVNIDLNREMSAHLAYNLIKNDYSQVDDEVVFKIQWCSMFVIHADRFFHPIIRYHVYKASEHFFRLYRPSLLSFLRPVIFPSNAINNQTSHTTTIEDQTVCSQAGRSIGKSDLIRSSFFSNYFHDEDSIPPWLTWSNNVKIWYNGETIANSVAWEVFEKLDSEIWPLCEGIRVKKSPWIFESQIELYLSKIPKSSSISDKMIENDLLKGIFEHPSVQSRIHDSIIDCIPNYIRTNQSILNERLATLKNYLQKLELDPIRSTPISGFISLGRLWFVIHTDISKVREYITDYEKQLQKLGDISQLIDEFCELALRQLYHFGINKIRRMIWIRRIISYSKEKEQLRRKSLREKRQIFKNVGDSRKSSPCNPTAHFSMKKYRWKR